MRLTCPRLKPLALAFILAATPAFAQTEPTSTPRDSAPQTGHKHLFGRRDVFLAGAFAATTVMLFPLDRQLALSLQDSSVQANRIFKNAAQGVELIASPGAYYIGSALYIVGRVGRMPRIADLGLHGTEAVLFGEGTSMLIKGLLGRQRPFVDVDDPRNFAFGRGFGESKWRSFPSGHTTTAFAAAAAVTDETTMWWPESTWIIAPMMYGGAALVAVSRMYHNRHWASDVAVGALIGTMSGKKVVLASHSNPNNVIDRFMLGSHIAQSEFGGINIGFAGKW